MRCSATLCHNPPIPPRVAPLLAAVRLQRYGTACGGFVVTCVAVFNSRAEGSASWKEIALLAG
jgi:hypothetical protein